MTEILKLGRLELLTKTKTVKFPLTDETKNEIQLMKETLQSIPSSAGLAANQIGVDKQIIVYRLPIERMENKEEATDEIMVLINPEVEIESEEKENGWEGCLSIPSIRAVVPRHKSIHVSGYDQDGVLHEKHVSGFHARNLQHEIDHLNGLTIFSRIENYNFVSFKSELPNGIIEKSNFKTSSMGNIP
jgi:peptide deformylase